MGIVVFLWCDFGLCGGWCGGFDGGGGGGSSFWCGGGFNGRCCVHRIIKGMFWTNLFFVDRW